MCRCLGGVLAFGVYQTSDLMAARLHLLVAAADNTESIHMAPNLETFVVSLALVHDRSVGIGSCTGCGNAACVLLRDVTFYDNEGSSVSHMPLPPEKTILAWQGTTSNCLAVPIRNRSWSEVKALYR